MRDHFRLVLSKAVIQETKINRRHVPTADLQVNFFVSQETAHWSHSNESRELVLTANNGHRASRSLTSIYILTSNP